MKPTICLFTVILCFACLKAEVFKKFVRAEHVKRYPCIFKVDDSCQTPHIKWNKPSACGSVKVLAIAPRWTHRETVELRQRFDFDIIPFLSDRSNLLGDKSARLSYGSATRKERTKELDLKLAQNLDVILVGSMDWKAFEEKSVKLILDKVRSGTGLVIANCKNVPKILLAGKSTELHKQKRDAILTNVPSDILTALKSDPKTPPVDIRKLGKGHVVFIHYKDSRAYKRLVYITPNPFNKIKSGEYDYYLSLAGKAILIASGHITGAMIKEIKMPKIINRDKADELKISVSVESAGQCSALSLRCRIHPLDQRKGPSRIIHIGDLAADKTVVKDFIFKDLDGKTGQWVADIWLEDQKGCILDWSSAPFTMASDCGIKEIVVSGKAESFGEIRGVVKLAGKLKMDESVTVALIDGVGRVLARKTLAGKGPELNYSLKIPRLIHRYLKLQTILNKAGHVRDEKAVQIPVRERTGDWGWNDFSLMGWGEPEDTDPGRHLGALYARIGMDKWLGAAYLKKGWNKHAAFASKYNVQLVPYVSRIAMRSGKSPGWANGHAHKKIEKLLKDCAGELAPYGIDTYSMGDENIMGSMDGAVKAHLFPEARDYYKKKYVKLENLNREWGSDYKTWNEVMPGIAKKDAVTNGDKAKWVDQCLFLQNVYSRVYKAGVKGVKSIDPTARVGTEGICHLGPGSGADFSEFGKYGMEFSNTYPVSWHLGGVQQSFLGPNAYIGWWTGTYPDLMHETVLERIPWRCLCAGMNSVHFYGSFPGNMWAGLVNHDLSPNRVTAGFIQSVKDIKSGPGKLLIISKKIDYGIGVQYSYVNTFVSDIRTFNWRPLKSNKAVYHSRMEESRSSFAALIKDCQLQNKWISSEQIANKKTGGLKVIILPFSQAIEKKEAQALKEFVKNGGTVIADIRPGVCDGHGKLLPKSPLSDLFGVKFDPNAEPAKPEKLTVTATINGKKIKGTIPRAQVDPGVSLTTGKALGKINNIPLVITNQYGKGQAVLLNFINYYYSIGCYERREISFTRGTGESRAQVEIMSALFKLAGITPWLSVDEINSGKKAKVIDLSVDAYELDQARFYGITINDECGDFIRIYRQRVLDLNFTRPAYLYNIREKRFLGHTDRLDKVLLPPGGALLLSALPYKVDGIELSVPAKAVPGKEITIKAEIKLENDTVPVGRHVLNLRVSDPAGRSEWLFLKNTVTKNGTGEFKLPLALNAPEGLWRITVTDAATGVKSAVTIYVVKLPPGERI